MNTDVTQNMQQATGFGEQPQGTFEQQNYLNTQDNSFQQPMSNIGQSSTQNAFGNMNPNTFGHPSQSSMAFGQTNSFES